MAASDGLMSCKRKDFSAGQSEYYPISCPRVDKEEPIFIEQPSDRYNCLICHCVMREPHIVTCCSRKMCRDCIQRVNISGQPCPHCREPNFSSFLEKQLNGEILDLKVRCTHHKNGCEWVGELRDLKNHTDSSCKFAKVKCPFGCSVAYLHKDAMNHESVCTNLPPEMHIKRTMKETDQFKEELQATLNRFQELYESESARVKELTTQLEGLKASHRREQQELKIQFQAEKKQLLEESKEQVMLLIKSLRAEFTQAMNRSLTIKNEELKESYNGAPVTTSARFLSPSPTHTPATTPISSFVASSGSSTIHYRSPLSISSTSTGTASGIRTTAGSAAPLYVGASQIMPTYIGRTKVSTHQLAPASTGAPLPQYSSSNTGPMQTPFPLVTPPFSASSAVRPQLPFQLPSTTLFKRVPSTPVPQLIPTTLPLKGSTGTATATTCLTTTTTTASAVSQFNAVSTTSSVFTLSSTPQISFATSTAKPSFNAMPTAPTNFVFGKAPLKSRPRVSSKGSSGLNIGSRGSGGKGLALSPTVEEEEKQKQRQIPVQSESTSQAFQTGTGQKATPSSFLFTAQPGGFTFKKPVEEARNASVSSKKEEDKAETLESIPIGEENERVMFCGAGKLFRFDSGQWKDRGAGQMKILLNRSTGKWRCVMRRDQTHILCCNFLLAAGMSLSPYRETNVVFTFSANDNLDGESKFALRFKTKEIAERFKEMFDRGCHEKGTINKSSFHSASPCSSFGFVSSINETSSTGLLSSAAVGFSSFSDIASGAERPSNFIKTKAQLLSSRDGEGGKEEGIDNPEEEADIYFKPVVTLPETYDYKSTEKGEILFDERGKLYRFDSSTNQWKERGLGNMKIIYHHRNRQTRLLMRRDQILNLCCNHYITDSMSIEMKIGNPKVTTWFTGADYSEWNVLPQKLALRFKHEETAKRFKDLFEEAVSKAKKVSNMNDEEEKKGEEEEEVQDSESDDNDDSFWTCPDCSVKNDINANECVACEAARPNNN